MDEMPREVLEARLRLDECLDGLLKAGDDQTLLRAIELIRGDLRMFAKHGRQVALANDRVRARVESERLPQAAGAENVTWLTDHIQRRGERSAGRP
jgi:hypothetical protein